MDCNFMDLEWKLATPIRVCKMNKQVSYFLNRKQACACKILPVQNIPTTTHRPTCWASKHCSPDMFNHRPAYFSTRSLFYSHWHSFLIHTKWHVLLPKKLCHYFCSCSSYAIIQLLPTNHYLDFITIHQKTRIKHA